MPPLLSVRDLSLSFVHAGRSVSVLDHLSFEIYPGETLGMVGESGCGKSVTAFSLMSLLPHPSAQITGGEILFEGSNLLDLPPDQMRRFRGDKIAMIFQEPMTALNPVHTIFKQINEIFLLHRTELDQLSKRQREAENLLDMVGISLPKERLKAFPHQLSGGMLQRVMIAMALACRPRLLIADEPTTALDVTIQAQILALIDDLQKQIGMAVLFITHDMGVIARICTRVLVMYAGRLVETAAVEKIFQQRGHPYTQGLMHSIPTARMPAKSPLPSIAGTVPSAEKFRQGCRFYDRCDQRLEKCAEPSPPPLNKVDEEHHIACFLFDEKSEEP